MDCETTIWNPWRSDEPNSKPLRRMRSHILAVQDIAWSPHGKALTSVSFDTTGKLTDIETGKSLATFSHSSAVNCVKYLPAEADVFVTGESDRGMVSGWDVRTPSTPIWTVQTPHGRILDVEFSPDGTKMLTSLHSARRGGMDQPIIVWDARKRFPLATQVYMEGYICPSLKFHPHEPAFVAQSHGEYIAIFSGKPPFKLNNKVRFEGHQVSGFRVQCDFSPDGSLLASGSSDGKLYIYSWKSARALKVLEVDKGGSCCSDASWHPVLPSTVACCSWDGSLTVLE